MKMNDKIFSLLDDLINTLRILRSPGGCDWDIEQTSKSLIPYLLEETYELIEAIENDDNESVKEELGDILLHIIFQTELAYENKNFSLEDVILDIKNKLVKRHPHIFSKNKAKNNWELEKQKEKKRQSVLDGVPKALPALARSYRIQEKAASVGFNWEKISLIWDKVDEELKELKELKDANQFYDKTEIKEELGDLLFTIVNLSRYLEVNAEEALKSAIKKFENRFHKIENHIKINKATFNDFSNKDLNELWKKIK